MNVSVYLFGEFSSGYTQYPSDYASDIFIKFYANAKSTTQLAIHRNGNLIYYGYIRKLKQGRYIGLCVVLNSLALTRIDVLFTVFEHTISEMVSKGQLIHFNDQGEIVSRVDKLYLCQEEFEHITESLRADFRLLERYMTPLPPVSYGTSKDSIKELTVDDDKNEIIQSSYTNGYTYVYKSKDYNTTQLNSYINTLTKSNQEKKELQEKLEKLQSEHAKTLRQKKQVKVVMFLLIVLVGCAFGLFALNDNLNTTSNELNRANNTIEIQNDSLSSKSSQISSLHSEKVSLKRSLDSEKYSREKIEKKYEKLKETISKRQPFIVKNTSFNFSNGYLTFDYYGISEGWVTLKVKAYADNGECYSNNSDVYIEEGDNSGRIFLSTSLNRNTWYSFELLKDGVIIGGARH